LLLPLKKTIYLEGYNHEEAPMKLSGSYDEMSDDFLDDVFPLTEASCTLQDYMNAQLRYSSDLQQKYSYYECLFEVIKERADSIQENEQ
jgi:hypothetical protein